MVRILAAAAAALLLVLASRAARAQEYVVIESSVPSLALGATVPAGATLAVPAKGRVVLVNANGQVTTITGPYQGAPPAAPAGAGGGTAPGSNDVVKLFATLMGSGGQRQALGAVRGTDAAWRQETVHTLADVLAINVTDGGDVCLYDANHATVTHDPAHDGTMSIEDMSGGGKARLQWPKDTTQLPWPAALPLTDGGNYLFEQQGAGDATVAVIHLLQADGGVSEIARAAQMAKAGCADQARLLLALVARSAK